MWLPSRFKELGEIDVDPALRALEGVLEADWVADEDVRSILAGDRPANSIFFYLISDIDFESILSQRPLIQEDVRKPSVPDGLFESCRYLLDFAREAVGSDGVFVRVQLARMLPGSIIAPHFDSSKILINSHRLHIPLITNKKVRFVVDGERTVMNAGRLYELNNQLIHSVDNPKDASTRIHLIMDFLPSKYNHPNSLDDSFQFKIREDRASRKKAASAKEIVFPKVVATSVVRGAHQNQSHGGVYIIDFKTNDVEQVVDWNTCDIDFTGRGWDRGLRGISISNKSVWIAASNELFEYDEKFNVLNSYKNSYLRHAHEIVIEGRFLYMTSTGFDAVLCFDLRKKKFVKGWKLELTNDGGIGVNVFNPDRELEVVESNRFHINSVFVRSNTIYVSGRGLPRVFIIKDDKFALGERIPVGTHNVQMYGKGYIYNDTNSDKVVYSSNYDYRSVDVPQYDIASIENYEMRDDHLARPGFGRGLCSYYTKGFVIAGSSPSTVSLIDFNSRTIVKSVNITMDVRNAIHGLEIWPF